MRFIYPKKNNLFSNNYFILAITIYMNGCAHTNDVASMLTDKHKNENNCQVHSLSNKANQEPNTIYNLLINCGLSEEEIEVILPNEMHKDSLNKVFEPMQIRKEDELNKMNTSYLLLRVCPFKCGNYILGP